MMGLFSLQGSVAVFLASYVNGHVLSVDGGMGEAI